LPTGGGARLEPPTRPSNGVSAPGVVHTEGSPASSRPTRCAKRQSRAVSPQWHAGWSTPRPAGRCWTRRRTRTRVAVQLGLIDHALLHHAPCPAAVVPQIW